MTGEDYILFQISLSWCWGGNKQTFWSSDLHEDLK